MMARNKDKVMSKEIKIQVLQIIVFLIFLEDLKL